MRRPLVCAVMVALALGACGDDSTEPAETSALARGACAAATSDVDGTGESIGTIDATAVDDDAELVPADSTTTLPRGPKPTVSVPAEIPSALQVTDLLPGIGYAAAVGDTVMVDYIGVRTVDGAEFDNSYGRDIPFEFPLGQGRVIAGWEQGLIGVQVGTKRQLDVPGDLAYGDSPPGGSVIQIGDALTFVVEVRAVIPAAQPAPVDIVLEPSVGATELTLVDVVDGAGEPVEEGQTAVVHMLLVRGDNEAILLNTWEGGEPLEIQLVEGGSVPGLVAGIEGMCVGGRRVITMPPDEAFGPGGDPQLGLPANTDLIVVAELFGLY